MNNFSSSTQLNKRLFLLLVLFSWSLILAYGFTMWFFGMQSYLNLPCKIENEKSAYIQIPYDAVIDSLMVENGEYIKVGDTLFLFREKNNIYDSLNLVLDYKQLNTKRELCEKKVMLGVSPLQECRELNISEQKDLNELERYKIIPYVSTCEGFVMLPFEKKRYEKIFVKKGSNLFDVLSPKQTAKIRLDYFELGIVDFKRAPIVYVKNARGFNSQRITAKWGENVIYSDSIGFFLRIPISQKPVYEGVSLGMIYLPIKSTISKIKESLGD